MLQVAEKALMQPGVSSEMDEKVLDYLDEHLDPGMVGMLSMEDREVLRDNRYDFVLY